MTLRRIALPLASAATLALAACSGGRDETPPAETNTATMSDQVNMTALPAEAPAPTRVDNGMAESPSTTTAPDLSPDERTQADADAAGMTSRVDRDVEVNQNGQPVQ